VVHWWIVGSIQTLAFLDQLFFLSFTQSFTHSIEKTSLLKALLGARALKN